MFIDAGHRRRGVPRGIVPYMATKKRSALVITDDMRSLMHEIDLRLNDCRGFPFEYANDTKNVIQKSLTNRACPTPPDILYAN